MLNASKLIEYSDFICTPRCMYGVAGARRGLAPSSGAMLHTLGDPACTLSTTGTAAVVASQHIYSQYGDRSVVGRLLVTNARPQNRVFREE